MTINRTLFFRAFLVLFSISIFSVSVHAGPFGAGIGARVRSRVTQCYPTDYFAPGHYGYNINDGEPGYFGGLRFKEYYSYGRGFGLANSVPPVPGPSWLFDHRNYAAGRLVNPFSPTPPPTMTSEAIYFASKSAQLIVDCPVNAQVWLDNNASREAGPIRQFISPPLRPGATYKYTLRARWIQDGKPVEQVQNVSIKAGDKLRVGFPMPVRTNTEPGKLPLEITNPTNQDR